MPCPFPGMDPYIERPAIFGDFHDSLIYLIKAALQPRLRPKYVAISRDRLYVVESERPIYPDVAVIKARSQKGRKSGGSALIELDRPTIFELDREEVRQPYLEIIEPAAGDRVVTAIEVLSPDNKHAGPGRDSYLTKRDEFWDSGTNLVEIDLLREGTATVRVSPGKLEELRPWHYLVGVTRQQPAREEVYAIPLQHRLPRVAIPLTDKDNDVGLDLQAAFTRCWNEGPYPELLRYEGPPPGRLPAKDRHWCESLLRKSKFRKNGRGS